MIVFALLVMVVTVTAALYNAEMVVLYYYGSKILNV